MKIEETTERECCEPQDLIRVICEDRVHYCRHCGKRWHRVKEVDMHGIGLCRWYWRPLP